MRSALLTALMTALAATKMRAASALACCVAVIAGCGMLDVKELNPDTSPYAASAAR
jgi:hypothetical protein